MDKNPVSFYFDISSISSYIAFKKCLQIPHHHQSIQLVPVIGSEAEKQQWATGATAQTVPPAKSKILRDDITRNLLRFNIKIKRAIPSALPETETTFVQQLLCEVAESNFDQMWPLVERFFFAFWEEAADLSPIKCKSLLASLSSPPIHTNASKGSQLLQNNTQDLISKGGVGVPSFFVSGTKKLYFGPNRLNFVIQDHFGKSQKEIMQPISPNLAHKNPTIEFYFDFSSPWAFIGFASQMLNFFHTDFGAKIIFKPILLGALFKEIGTPMVPMAVLSPAMLQMNSQDMLDWTRWWGINLKWPTQFPIRTPQALRLSIVEPKLIPILFQAAWQEDINIGEQKNLELLLEKKGFSQQLIAKSSQEDIKLQLRNFTEEAKQRGICGVPTFVINGGDPIWGQDKYDVLCDILQGRLPHNLISKSSL